MDQAPTGSDRQPPMGAPSRATRAATRTSAGMGLGATGVGGAGSELSPLQFLLSVMKDSAATPRLRVKAARVAARYQHAPAVPDKMPAVDEYGFAIHRSLAMAIKDDWLALEALDVSSKAASKRAIIRARQAQRDQVLHCPTGYSPWTHDVPRYQQLRKKRRSLAEETELAHIMARITASEAAFNRSPEGQIHRRLEDLEYRRKTANEERNRRAGLTRAEGKELDELRKEYPRTLSVAATVRVLAELGMTLPPDVASRPPPTSVPESEMEELGPTMEDILNQATLRRQQE